MAWQVAFDASFEREFQKLPEEIQDELLAHVRLLQVMGPRLARPRADTLNGSRYTNMKELRFDAAGGVWRVAYAFDPRRQGILLVAGDKSGVSEDRFYKRLIEKADRRYGEHLARLRQPKPKK
jgi:hypothetical protein